MARDKGDDDKRRRGRGKSEDGPSDEELDWLADLRGSRDSRASDPFSDGPRTRRTLRTEEPPTGGIVRGGGPGTPPATGPAPGQGVRPVRRTPPLPPISPAGPTTPPATPAGSPPAPAGPPPAPPAQAPAKRGLLRRTPAAPPPPPAAPPPPPAAPPPPPAAPPPPVPPPPPAPTPPARASGARPMIDWSDLTGELPAASGPAAPPVAPGPPPMTARPTSPPSPEPPRRPAEPRPAALRADPPRPGGAASPGPAIGPAPGLGGPPEPPGLAGPAIPADAMVTTGMIRRAELRKHLRIQQQLKTVTLTLVVLLMLAAYPVYLFVQTLTRDPVFAGLDGLDLPSWAAYEHADRAEGSRWCIDDCRFRTRSWLSERPPEETQGVYAQALHDAGWRTYVGTCQQSADESVITCWKKDEYVMVMHVYEPVCEAPPPREPVPGASESAEPAPEPSASRPACPGAYVTMYITNAIDYQPQQL